jgi:hypothetical protein
VPFNDLPPLYGNWVPIVQTQNDRLNRGGEQLQRPKELLSLRQSPFVRRHSLEHELCSEVEEVRYPVHGLWYKEILALPNYSTEWEA